MPKPAARRSLPQAGGPVFITDGGLETTLVFHEKLDLPDFNASALLRDGAGQGRLASYYRRYAEIARHHGAGLILETPTWRASAGWFARLGLGPFELEEFNRTAVAMQAGIRAEYDLVLPRILVSGCVGPRGDGYVPDRGMSAAEAQDYHAPQVGIFADTEADFVSAMTITTIEEATGIVRAAQAHAIPVSMSFTVETDGRLPTGQTLQEAIETVDELTGGGPAYYMINCAHPTHFEAELRRGGEWTRRILALRANASSSSHAELNESPVLDEGNPADFARRYAELHESLPHLAVFGGCCGTDHRHVGAVCAAVTARRAASLVAS